MGTTLTNTGNLLKKKGENDKAAESYTRAREIYISLLSQDPDNAVFRSYAGDNLNNYATFLMETGSFERACEILKESIEIYGKLFEEKPDNIGYQAELSVALSQLGSCLMQQGPEKKDAAKQDFDKALAMQENLLTQQLENKKIQEAIALTRNRLEGL